MIRETDTSLIGVVLAIVALCTLVLMDLQQPADLPGEDPQGEASSWEVSP